MPLFINPAFIGPVIGTAVLILILIKYLQRPKRKKGDGYLIKDVHVIVGDGSELFHQNPKGQRGTDRRPYGSSHRRCR